MIRVRITSALLSTLLLTLVVIALTGCAAGDSDAPTTRPSSRTAYMAPAAPASPSPAPTGLARTDPAVWAAVQFERAHCGWNWQQTRQAYVAGQQQLATPRFAQQLASESDPVSWREQVVAQKQTVTCTVSNAARDSDAPTTPTTVYVRMTASTGITSTLGSFIGGDQIASWLVVRTADGWRVAGGFEGG